MEAAQAALDRMAALQPDNNAFITTLADHALAEAEAVQKKLAAGEELGPLAGVPMALKDNICTRGVKTSCASKILGDFTPPYDATLTERTDDFYLRAKTMPDTMSLRDIAAEVATRLNRNEDEIFAVLKMPNVSKPMPWQVPTSFPLPQP